MLTGSTVCSKGELDIFSVPPTLTTIESLQNHDYFPLVSPKDNTAPLEFKIPRLAEHWIDPSVCYRVVYAAACCSRGMDQI